MKRFIIQLIFCIILSSLCLAQTNAPPVPLLQGEQSNLSTDSELTSWSTYAKDIAQVFFWITMGVVAILTYRRAKKTILQPLRTEVFKVQLKEMSAILSMFVGKGEIELRNAFAFDKLLLVNTVSMYDAYAKTFFDYKVDYDKRPYSTNECPTILVTEEGMMKFGKLDDAHLRKDVPASSEEEKDPRVRAALWADYVKYDLSIPRQFSEQEKKIDDMLENPLLPTECVKLLNEYREVVNKNVNLVRNLLTKCAKEMPTKYPSLGKLNSSSFAWINNQFAEEFIHLKPEADKIITFVRSRYDVDNLLKE